MGDALDAWMDQFEAQPAKPPEGAGPGMLQKAKDFVVSGAKDMAKDELARTAVIAALGPMAAVMPLAERPITKLVRSQFPGEPPTTAEEATKQGLKDGAIETGVNILASGIPAIRRPVGALATRLGESKVINGLSAYLKSVTERNGPPEALKGAAGKIMEEAVSLAGDTKLGVDRFIAFADDLAKSSQNPFSTKLDPLAEEIVGAAERLASKGGATLAEIKKGLEHWTAKVADLANDPAKQRIAKMAKDAMVGLLDDATGNPAIGKAAETLAAGRKAYAKAASAEDLQRVLLKSEGARPGSLNPKRFVELNSRENREEIERLFANDPEGLELWNKGIDAAIKLSEKGTSWAPDSTRIPGVSKLIDNLVKSHGVIRILSDKPAAKAFLAIVSPERSAAPEAIAAMASTLAKRMASADRESGDDRRPSSPMPREPLANRSPAAKF